MDPDRFHEAMQPFADGAVDLDEHDLEGGGFDNTDGILPELIAMGGSGQTFDPGIVHANSNWDITLANAQEHVPGDGWSVIQSTETEITTEGGMLMLTGMAQYGRDYSAGTLGSRVALAILIDGSPYIELDAPGQAMPETVPVPSGAGAAILGHSGHAGVQAVDLMIPIEGGTHTLSLALQVLGRTSVYSYNCQLSHVEFRC